MRLLETLLPFRACHEIQKTVLKHMTDTKETSPESGTGQAFIEIVWFLAKRSLIMTLDCA